MKVVVNEKFNDFPLKEFPYDINHSAVGEYHHYMNEGYTGNFYDPINNHQWRSMGGTWLVTEVDGTRYMEQNRGHYSHGYFSDLTCLLVLREVNISNFVINTEITMLSTKYYSGIAFLYRHSQKYYGIKMENDRLVFYYKNQTNVKTLAEVNYKFESLKKYELNVIKNKDQIKVIINNKIIFEYKGILEIDFGTVALMSQNPTRYKYLEVLQEDKDYKNDVLVNKEISKQNKDLLKLQPSMKLINKIELNGNGSARQLRIFKHDDVNYFIFAQHEKKIFRDAFASISALTCFDENGKQIWQIGTPSSDLDNALISCDLPFQVSDMNGDGIPELIYAKDFNIIIANALTGETIKQTKTPFVRDDELVEENYPFDYLNVDAIRVANFTNKNLDYQSDFIIKDRYRNVWAFNYDFKLLFRYNHKNTGHFPYIYDFDNDGLDEMLVGYDFVKNGKIIWSLPFNSDHTDEIIWGPLKDNEEYKILLASGNEGFNVVDLKGNIVKSIPVGHAQRISLAKYDKHREGYQTCVTSFWGSNGIIYTFDANLELIAEREMIGNGNIVTPVNYDNSGQSLILSSTDPEYGGLLDINLNTVVKFPDDGHPTLASEAIDLDGDGVTEILTWDQNSLWIYKASKLTSNDIREFYQYPHNAFSNYRGEFLIEKKVDKNK